MLGPDGKLTFFEQEKIKAWLRTRHTMGCPVFGKVIRHTAGEYIVGVVQTNGIEGFWSIFKRGVVGRFLKVSMKYLRLCLSEFQFGYNNRENDNIFAEAIGGC